MRRPVLLAAALALLLCGCRGQTPIPVSAAAFEPAQAGGWRMTAELIRQDSLDGDAAPVYLTAEGLTPEALFADASRRLGAPFSFSHAETLLLDERLAASGLAPLISALADYPDTRLTLHLAVAQSADKLLRMEALSESIPGVALTALLENDPTSTQSTLYRVRRSLADEGDFTLPVLTETPDGHAAIGGRAEFSHGALTRMTVWEVPHE